MLGLVKKIFGTEQSRKLKRFKCAVKEINRLEEVYKNFSDEQIKSAIDGFRVRIKGGESPDCCLNDVYAIVKNVCRRLVGSEFNVSGHKQVWDLVPYDVQLIGAVAMYYGSIAEMQTGEGKTLTSVFPLVINALGGEPSHLVTVNDYLATRDCEWMGPIFNKLGLSAKALVNAMPLAQRKDVYAADIVYGTASEFGFDFLRDSYIATSADAQCQRGHYFVLIDEVDSVLIDEARTPLIISGPSAQQWQMYGELRDVVDHLVRMQLQDCGRRINRATEVISHYLLDDITEKRKLSKDEHAAEDKAFRELWLVGRGAPRNLQLRKLKENPDIRAIMEKWEGYFYSETNRKERHAALSNLYIIVDEKAGEFELTDKGIEFWIKKSSAKQNDFVMLDLGEAYGKIDEDKSLSDQEKLQKKLEVQEEDRIRKERSHSLRQLFKAYLLMERDVDYIVQKQDVVIVDPNTGRLQPGRHFSNGLHQAIQAKESVPIQRESQTYATITLQNYFRMYGRRSGMTGTAITEATEFREIYGMDVVVIPTNKPCLRKDAEDEVYMSEREKYNAIVKEIISVHETGRPVLVGTESVDSSERLSKILARRSIQHSVLNAKNHAREAEIIAKAGVMGAVTISTKMAGRGVDIRLSSDVVAIGGLHVIVTVRYQSRRIDRQFRGRCARQGDPGSSKFFVSFDDDLLRSFSSSRLTSLLQKWRPPEGEHISAKIVSKSIEIAQKRIEQQNYAIRKHTLQYDDVMEKQRNEIYLLRNEILHSSNTYLMAEDFLKDICSFVAKSSLHSVDSCDFDNFSKMVVYYLPITFGEDFFVGEYQFVEQIEDIARCKVVNEFRKKVEKEKSSILAKSRASGFSVENFLGEVIRNILLRVVDQSWQDHLLAIDHLRTEVGVSSVGQRDPVLEFKHEAFALFHSLTKELYMRAGYHLFKFEIFTGRRPSAG